MLYILIILSFLFEAAITNIIYINTFLTPLFLLTSLTILYPYFKNKTNFVIACIICGLFYDMAFCDSIFINTICFGICSFFIIMCYNYFKYNIYSSNLINIVNIVVYRLESCLLLVIIDYIKFNKYILFESIYNSIVINIIYGIIIYLIADLISKIFNIKKE